MDLNALLITLCWTQVLQVRFSQLCFIIGSFSCSPHFEPLIWLDRISLTFISPRLSSELSPGRVQYPLWTPQSLITSPLNLVLLVK